MLIADTTSHSNKYRWKQWVWLDTRVCSAMSIARKEDRCNRCEKNAEER
jgi:hypothetical protein